MDFFIEVDHRNIPKHGQIACGDNFISKRIESERRIISVLSDGLGSGVKASVLSTLSSTMALNFVSNDTDIYRLCELIMETLPVCKVRKIGYSTFTIVDMDFDGNVKVVEYENPSYILTRQSSFLDVKKKEIPLKSVDGRDIKALYSEFKMITGDRLLFYSDGVTQSGIGLAKYPMGWGDSGVRTFIKYMLGSNPDIAAGDISQKVVGRAKFVDEGINKDDITCATIYIREPRVCSVFTGPPVDKDSDSKLAEKINLLDHKVIVCGGTTATIIARELNLKVVQEKTDFDSDLPPCSQIDGIDLVTEGTLTLGKVANILDFCDYFSDVPKDGAEKMVAAFMESDIINFYVGLKVNEAHQNPKFAWDLDLRRNVVRKITNLLTKKFLKSITVNFV